jgi:hypothetical protein
MQALLFFSCAKIAVHIIDMKELEVWEPMVTSYPVEGEKPEMYTISSFLYFLCINCKSYNEQKAI